MTTPNPGAAASERERSEVRAVTTTESLAEYDARVMEALRADGEAIAESRRREGLELALAAVRAIPGGQLSRERINKALRGAFTADPSTSVEDAVMRALGLLP